MVDNVPFPLTISYMSVGGPTFMTQVVTSRSGAEQRNATWATPRRKWTADLTDITRSEVATLIAFWIARQGKRRGFRWQDPSDYWAVDQPLVNNLSTSLQLQMTYPDAVNPSTRNITRPVQGITTEKSFAGIVLVKTHNGSTTTLVEGTDYTVDYMTGTGLVTLATAAVSGDGYAWSGQFDTPARFDTDELSLKETDLSALSWENFTLIEILEPES